MAKWFKKSGEEAIKATTRESYLESTFQPISGRGGAVRKPENYTGFMQRFTGWVYAAAQQNARGVAAQTLRLYAVRPENATKSLYKTRELSNFERAYLSGSLEHRPSKHVTSNAAAGGVNVEEVVEHPILDVLNNPSPDMDGYSLTVLRMLNLQLTGNSYLHPIISESLGVPVELYSMASNLVEIIADPSFDNLVAGYLYGMQNTTNEFAPNEVLHERQPNPLDMYYGKGWVSAAIEAIDLLESMQEYEQNLLENEARPDWAVMVKDNMTDGQFQRLENSIKKKLQGKGNRGVPFIFEGGMDAKTLSFSPRDLAFSEGENRKVEVIAAISGVPVSKLKANDPNLASAREGNLGWLRDTILPYLVLDEQFLNRQLVPMFGQYSEGLFLAYDNPVPQDDAALATVAASDIAAGIRTRNEVRAERGLPPVDGGDEIMIAGGTLPLEVAIEQAKNPPQAMPFGAFSVSDNKEPAVVDDAPPAIEPAKAIEFDSDTLKKILDEVKKVEPSDCECCTKGEIEISQRALWSVDFGAKAEVDTGNADYNRLLRDYNTSISKLETDLVRIFNQQLTTIVDSGFDLQKATSESEQPLQETIGEFVEDVIQRAGKDAFEELGMGVEFRMEDDQIREFVRTYTSRLVNEVNRTTMAHVGRIVNRGTIDGLSTAEVARQISALEGIETTGRATVIARTEISTLTEESRLQAWEQSGIVTGKQWVVAAGACAFCRQVGIDHPNAIPLDENFYPFPSSLSAGGKTMRLDYRPISSPPLHPNCRCGQIQSLMDEEQ